MAEFSKTVLNRTPSFVPGSVEASWDVAKYFFGAEHLSLGTSGLN